jgi:type II secretion system protein L
LATRSIEHLNQLAAREPANDGGRGHIDLWVPSESVLVFELELPKVSRRKLDDMLPWMLEEQLLGAPSEFEFVTGPAVASGTLVFAVPKAELSRWQMLAQSHGGSAVRMAPDYLALPFEEGRWTLCIEDGRMLVRTGTYTGFSASIDTGWAQLELLARQKSEPVRYSCLQKTKTDVPEYFTGKLDVQAGSINWSFTELPLGINLLPARLKSKKSSGFRQWWPVAASFAFFCLLALSFLLVQSWVWQRDITVLEQGVSATYQQLFAEPLRGSAADAVDLAQSKMSLLEHQYITLQRPPIAQLVSLDRIFSTCADCDMLLLEQSENGIQIELNESEQIKARLAGLPDWNYRWQPTDSEGVSRLIVEDGRQ